MSGDQADGLWRRVLCNSGLFVILAAPLGTAWTEYAARAHQFLPGTATGPQAARQGSAAQPH